MFRTFQVDHDERALLFRKGRLVDVLHAGVHEYFDPLKQLAAEAFPLARATFDPCAVAGLANADPGLVEREFDDVRLGATEVGLLYRHGDLAEVLAPGARRLVFKRFGDVRVARFDIGTRFALPYSLTQRFGNATSRRRIAGAEHVFVVEVPRGQAAMLVVDGCAHTRLRTGLHAFFAFGRQLHIEPVDPRAHATEAARPRPEAGVAA